MATKRSGHKLQPCLTPVVIFKKSVWPFSNLTQQLNDNKYCFMPSRRRIFQRDYLWTLTKAFLKLTKLMDYVSMQCIVLLRFLKLRFAHCRTFYSGFQLVPLSGWSRTLCSCLRTTQNAFLSLKEEWCPTIWYIQRCYISWGLWQWLLFANPPELHHLASTY